MSKISELSDGGVIQGGDTLIAVRSGGNVKVTYGGSTTANIDGGTIDGTVIGGTTAAAGSFTTGQFNTSLNVDGTVTADGLSVAGNANITGNTTLGDASTDTVTVNGRVGIGSVGFSHLGLFVSTSAILGGQSTAVASLRAGGTLGSDVTVDGSGLIAKINTEADSFTLTTARGVFVDNASKGAGSAITNLHGIQVSDQTQGTNNYGITSLVSSGTNKWNIYASGTAANYFAGSVGIGTSSPQDTGTGYSNLTINGTTGGVIDLTDDNVRVGSFFNTANDVTVGNFTATGFLGFRTNSTERARIDSSGNLLVGKTSLGIGVVGQEFRTGSSSYLTANNDTVLGLNRLSNDGTVLEFRKDSTIVGSIGSANSSSVTYLAGSASGGGIGVANNSPAVFPARPAGVIDNTISLGSGFYRFKDLYLSGGVYLGGTGAANKLDDYEEGTWTPAYSDDSGNVITNLTEQTGRYVKVGKLVYISGCLRTQSSSDASGLSGNLNISGLPFTQISTQASGRVGFHTHESVGSYNAPSELPRTSPVAANTTRINIYKYSGTGGRTLRFQVSDLNMSGNSNFIFFSGTYEAS